MLWNFVIVEVSYYQNLHSLSLLFCWYAKESNELSIVLCKLMDIHILIQMDLCIICIKPLFTKYIKWYSSVNICVTIYTHSLTIARIYQHNIKHTDTNTEHTWYTHVCSVFVSTPVKYTYTSIHTHPYWCELRSKINYSQSISGRVGMKMRTQQPCMITR